MEQRIAKLEQDLTSLRESFNARREIHQRLGGQARMYEAAVLALIVSHPRPDLLAPTFDEHLARVDANVVGEARSEAHVQGSQGAENLLRLALGVALERFRTRKQE